MITLPDECPLCPSSYCRQKLYPHDITMSSKDGLYWVHYRCTRCAHIYKFGLNIKGERARWAGNGKYMFLTVAWKAEV